MLLNELCVSLPKPNIDPEISAFIPAEALKRLSHGRNTVGCIRVLLSGRQQDTDAPHLLAVMRAALERPSGYTAAEKRDEFPPPHGAYPKAKDHGRSIAGVGVGRWRASQQKGRPMTGLGSSEPAGRSCPCAATPHGVGSATPPRRRLF